MKGSGGRGVGGGRKGEVDGAVFRRPGRTRLALFFFFFFSYFRFISLSAGYTHGAYCRRLRRILSVGPRTENRSSSASKTFTGVEKSPRPIFETRDRVGRLFPSYRRFEAAAAATARRCGHDVWDLRQCDGEDTVLKVRRLHGFTGSISCPILSCPRRPIYHSKVLQ